jgi:hypothetical protein
LNEGKNVSNVFNAPLQRLGVPFFGETPGLKNARCTAGDARVDIHHVHATGLAVQLIREWRRKVRIPEVQESRSR